MFVIPKTPTGVPAATTTEVALGREALLPSGLAGKALI